MAYRECDAGVGCVMWVAVRGDGGVVHYSGYTYQEQGTASKYQQGGH